MSTFPGAHVNNIVFDFDGTIADSRFAICEAMERACIRQGVWYVGDEEFSQYIGHDLDFCISHASLEPMDEDTIKEVARSYRETFRFNLVHMYDGMRRLLELCYDTGDKLAIVSTRHDESLLKLIDQLEINELLTAVVAGNQVSEPKPHQAMLWEAAKELQCNPRELIMVGDHIHDIEMANNCGAYAIGVTWGTHDESQLRNAGADVICTSPLALANHFNFAAV